jgi:hypothetical protein
MKDKTQRFVVRVANRIAAAATPPKVYEQTKVW